MAYFHPNIKIFIVSIPENLVLMHCFLCIISALVVTVGLNFLYYVMTD